MILAVLAMVWIILAFNCFQCRSTFGRMIRNLLVFQAIAATLFEAGNSGLLPYPVTMQLGGADIILVTTATYLLAASWLNRPARPGRLYLAALLCAATTLLLGTSARDHNVSADRYQDWTALPYWIAANAIALWSGALLLRASLADLRAESTTRVILLRLVLCMVACVMLLDNCAMLVNAGLLATHRSAQITDILADMHRHAALNYCVVTAMLSVVPLVARGRNRWGLDRWSRHRRRLLPLWQDLTAACPEIVYLAPPSLAEHRGRYLLHRTTVEIRDCMLILSRYTTVNPPAAAAEIDGPLAQAVALARAVDAKLAGAATGQSCLIRHSHAENLPAEADELTKLAEVWPQAKAIA